MQKKPGCLGLKGMENILLNNFILENNYLMIWEETPQGKFQEQLFFSLFLWFASLVENAVTGRRHLC